MTHDEPRLGACLWTAIALVVVLAFAVYAWRAV